MSAACAMGCRVRGRAPRRPPALLLVLLSGCATAPVTDAGLEPTEQLSTGLVALEASEYNVAYDNLIEVRSVCGDSPLGQQALLVLAAAELDPRNPERRIELAAEFAAHFLSLPNRAAWAQPLAESLYLLSMEIGASDAVGTALSRGFGDGDARAGGDDDAPSGGEPVTSMAFAAGPSDGAERATRLRRAVFGFVPHPVPLECGVHWQQVVDSTVEIDLPVLPLSPVTARIAELEQERVDLMRRQRALQDEIESLQAELARIRETLRP